ncbi:MAG: HNH endonuclease [Patescibacteria group bacterium]
MKRKALSKKVRFEVFKRDKFTCQYCGRKSPDILLHIDHIEPVSKGGDNDIINLITSCQECNLGKSNNQLSDNSVIEKQRRQVEDLQERREQIELMFAWKKSLSKLDEETIEMIKEYIHYKITPFRINENGEMTIKNLLRKYDIPSLLDAVDISADTYLRFSNDNVLDKDSVETFLGKLGGILFNRNLSPIDQKLAFIKNKAKSSFNYYDPRRGAILLSQYVAALKKNWQYSDSQIIEDIDNELGPRLEEAHNWSQWKNLIETWIESIEKKEEDNTPQVVIQNKQQEQLKAPIQGRINALEESIAVLDYILSAYPTFNKVEFKIALYEALIDFVRDQKELAIDELREYENDDVDRGMHIYNFTSQNKLATHWGYDYDEMLELVDDSKEDAEKLRLLMGLDAVVYSILEKLFDEHFFFSPSCYTFDDLSLIREMAIERLESLKN